MTKARPSGFGVPCAGCLKLHEPTRGLVRGPRFAWFIASCCFVKWANGTVTP